jgi:CHAD domain-containing protein
MTPYTSLSLVLHPLGQKLLADAQTQSEHLGTDNSEALHDFRVSVRRLRSFLKSYESYIRDAEKHREGFSSIMTLTNVGRDNEVHHIWLNIRQKKATDVEQQGMRYLQEHLSSEDALKVEKVKKQFASAARKLEKAFAKDLKEEKSFENVTAKVIQRYSGHLGKRLTNIQKPEDEKALHAARIMAKKLRYTLELLETSEAKPLIKELKGLQDIAGELHDLQLLESKVQTFLFTETELLSQAFRENATTLSHEELSKLPMLQYCYGLAAVQKRLEAEKTALADELQQKWLGEAAKDFFLKVSALAAELAQKTETETSETLETSAEPSKKVKTKRPKKQRSKKVKTPVTAVQEATGASV